MKFAYKNDQKQATNIFFVSPHKTFTVLSLLTYEKVKPCPL